MIMNERLIDRTKTYRMTAPLNVGQGVMSIFRIPFQFIINRK